MTSKTVLVTGGAGSIGAELCKQLSFKYRVVAVDQDESRLFDLKQECPVVTPVIADIRDMERIGRVISKYKPEIIFHAAAYKHVPLMEQFPREGWKTNVVGLMNVALNATYFGVKQFVFISSDKAVNPANHMGKTKKIGEQLCRTLTGDMKITIVRFGNVLASRGSVIPLFQKQIEKGEITLTHPNMERYFMTIPDAVELIQNATTLEAGTYIFDMGKPIKIADLAGLMVKISGKKVTTKYIGMRPGEKLSEELYSQSEKLQKTKFKSISKIC